MGSVVCWIAVSATSQRGGELWSSRSTTTATGFPRCPACPLPRIRTVNQDKRNHW